MITLKASLVVGKKISGMEATWNNSAVRDHT